MTISWKKAAIFSGGVSKRAKAASRSAIELGRTAQYPQQTGFLRAGGQFGPKAAEHLGEDRRAVVVAAGRPLVVAEDQHDGHAAVVAGLRPGGLVPIEASQGEFQRRLGRQAAGLADSAPD